MEQPALTILNAHNTMAIATVRPDGWPQNTIVGYANRGFDLYFMIFRSSQKWANLQLDDHIAIAVTGETSELSQLKAVYAGAHAREIVDPGERREAWRLLMERHSNLAGFQMPDSKDAVFMHARCKYLSVLDFSQGIGHREQLTVDDRDGVNRITPEKDRWGVVHL